VLATGGTFTAAAELATDAGFRVEQAGVLIDLGIVPELRFGGLALRTVIRYA
jgi:adenine/guanine phosphoribosyltransferase-like PRPP-binding protein